MLRRSLLGFHRSFDFKFLSHHPNHNGRRLVASLSSSTSSSTSTVSDAASAKPWTQPMPEAQFQWMRTILSAPSPIGLEGAMSHGVLKPHWERIARPGWKVHTFQGNAGLVLDTAPADQAHANGSSPAFSVLLVGHADKIRLMVRSIGDDGKVWVNSDSFLPTTLLGHRVTLFSESPTAPGQYRRFEGGTIEALGAIHFADAELRTGKKGIKPEQLYLDLQIYGQEKKKQVEALGIRPGDTLILDRPISRGFSPNTFVGAYLDNGLGCFTVSQVAELVSENAERCKNVRCLFAVAAYEEIGRFGSRVLAGMFKPDAIIAVDVNHDYVAAPGVGDRRFPPLEMGKGFTFSVGSIASEQLNAHIEQVAREHDIPFQRDPVGHDTGTDAMASVLASVDSAAASVGFPIRNMHTISETGHTGDVLAAVHVLYRTIEHLSSLNNGSGVKRDDFRRQHPRLDRSVPVTGPVMLQ